MDKELGESCRFCLSSDKTRSYYQLSTYQHVDQLGSAFGLISDLMTIGLHPGHLCDECHLVINRFMKLRQVAQINEATFEKQHNDTIIDDSESVLMDTEEPNSFEKEDEEESESIILKPKDIKLEPQMIVNAETGELISVVDQKGGNQNSQLSSVTVDSHENKTKKIIFYENGKVTSNKYIESRYDDDVALYKCDKCEKGFRTVKLLRNHFLTHTTEQVRCPICVPDRYVKPHVLRKHLKFVHKNQRDIPCEYSGCKKMFKQREVMKRHLQMVHMGEKILCNICGKGVLNIHYHKQNCNKENVSKSKCELCDRAYSCKKSLETHMLSVHMDIKETCPQCGKDVRFLKSHIKFVHEGEQLQRYPCGEPECDQSFVTKQNLSKHVNKVHEGERDQCEICFEWLKNLPSHMYQVHKQGKQHVCDDCGKVFYKSYDLKVHIQRVHEGLRHTCKECGKSIAKINEHMKFVHGIAIPFKKEIFTE